MTHISNMLSADQVQGDMFRLARTSASHFAGSTDPAPQSGEANFGRLLYDSLNGVSELEQTHQNLTVQAITDPDSVDPHDISVAAAKAEMGLNLTKNVLDRVIQAYRTITTVR